MEFNKVEDLKQLKTENNRITNPKISKEVYEKIHWNKNYQKMKLNLGCRTDKRKGYVNIDKSMEFRPDIVWDLEKLPLPFKGDSIDEILAYHVLEHICNFIPLMRELHRICMKDAVMRIKTPFYSAWGQYNDPTHVRSFTPFTFDNLSENYFNGFGVEGVRLNFGIGESKKLNWLFNPLLNINHKIYCRFFAWIFPCAEIEFELKVLK